MCAQSLTSAHAGDAEGSGSSGAPRPRVAFVSLGCRVNRADLDAMAARVAGSFTPVPEGEPADFVVVNTCTITHDADSSARQAIRRATRENPGARIIATGCYAELARETLAALPGVAAVVGVREQGSLARVLSTLAGGTSAEPGTAAPEASEWGPTRPAGWGLARPLLKVQDGCDQRCSYCVVPLARGPSRSMPLDAALARIEELGRQGPEVVLTGVHLGAWGRDLPGRPAIGALLKAASERGLARRLRLSSIESAEFPIDALVDAEVAAVLCDHFHLPLQSGSDRVLAAMNRPYAAADFTRVVEEIAALAPGACIGTDVMVGFPGETDEEFRETVRLIERLPFAYVHVFPFSPRPGTPAEAMAGQVPGPVARERARELVALGDRRWRSFLRGQAGHVLEVVVERVEGGLARGTSRQFATVRWPAAGEARGDLVRVRVEASDGQECFGISARSFASRLPP